MKVNSPHNFLSMTAAVAAALLVSLSTGHADSTDLYSALGQPANPQDAVHYLQGITLAQPAGVYSLSSFDIGLHFTQAATQAFSIEFYTGIDTSPTSADALANAVMIGGVSGNVTVSDTPLLNTGNYTFTFTLDTTTPLLLPAGALLGAEFTLTDTGANPDYSSIISGRFSDVTPTAGSATNFVWNDAGATFDNTFQGSEQTTFGDSGAYARLGLHTNAVTAVPDLGPTWAMLAVSFGVLALAARRRLA